MSGLVLKLIIVPALVLFLDFLIGPVFYPAFVQTILIGIMLAVVGHFVEILFLRPGRLWATTIVDVMLYTALLMLSPFAFDGARVTLDGALLLASLLGIAEYLYHQWIVRRQILQGTS
ncbi:hypothetical protein [Brevibacillus fulvus]|uniref:DUF2512 domain-containing protein n=1 Tax=Brevibacillus fulvus TaxID=1125967 RepID=A0A938Y449_9BACL|nr:hypothetical protein [Brevibacillus fulvus]MBM7591252.1 hypothetical protein [Brevibacillus fulvus]